jgi:hypothetical protein
VVIINIIRKRNLIRQKIKTYLNKITRKRTFSGKTSELAQGLIKLNKSYM